MIEILKESYVKLLSYELGRFLMVGGATVIIDLIFYVVLVYVDFDTSVSKGISFSIGTVFAYFANRNFTFRSHIASLYGFIIFILLYLSTLGVNVVINEIILDYTSRTGLYFTIAFLLSTLSSATLNFIGMKYIVFSVGKEKIV